MDFKNFLAHRADYLLNTMQARIRCRIELSGRQIDRSRAHAELTDAGWILLTYDQTATDLYVRDVRGSTDLLFLKEIANSVHRQLVNAYVNVTIDRISAVPIRYENLQLASSSTVSETVTHAGESVAELATVTYSGRRNVGPRASSSRSLPHLTSNPGRRNFHLMALVGIVVIAMIAGTVAQVASGGSSEMLLLNFSAFSPFWIFAAILVAGMFTVQVALWLVLRRERNQFPPKTSLLKIAYEARGNTGKIRNLLSEQTRSKASSVIAAAWLLFQIGLGFASGAILTMLVLFLVSGGQRAIGVAALLAVLVLGVLTAEVVGAYRRRSPQRRGVLSLASTAVLAGAAGVFLRLPSLAYFETLGYPNFGLQVSWRDAVLMARPTLVAIATCTLVLGVLWLLAQRIERTMRKFLMAFMILSSALTIAHQTLRPGLDADAMMTAGHEVSAGNVRHAACLRASNPDWRSIWVIGETSARLLVGDRAADTGSQRTPIRNIRSVANNGEYKIVDSQSTCAL